MDGLEVKYFQKRCSLKCTTQLKEEDWKKPVGKTSGRSITVELKSGRSLGIKKVDRRESVPKRTAQIWELRDNCLII